LLQMREPFSMGDMGVATSNRRLLATVESREICLWQERKMESDLVIPLHLESIITI